MARKTAKTEKTEAELQEYYKSKAVQLGVSKDSPYLGEFITKASYLALKHIQKKNGDIPMDKAINLALKFGEPSALALASTGVNLNIEEAFAIKDMEHLHKLREYVNNGGSKEEAFADLNIEIGVVMGDMANDGADL